MALEVEAALLALCGGTGVDYKTKARALIYNLGDVLNEKLRQNIASVRVDCASVVAFGVSRRTLCRARFVQRSWCV